MRRVRGFVLSSLLLLVSSLACSQPTLAVCDITQGACQEEVYYHDLSLRGDAYDPFDGLPPVSVMSEDQFRQALEQDASTASQSGPNPWDEAMLLLHFTSNTSSTTAPATGDDGGVGSGDAGAGSDAGTGSATIDDEVANTLAFYDSSKKNVTIIDHPSQTGTEARKYAMITLAHEFIHSLQDRELNLDQRDFQTSDQYLAYDSVIEGDARFYEILFANDLLKLGYTQSNIILVLDRMLGDYYAYLDQYQSSLFAAQALIYPLGAKYEATAYHAGGNAAVRHGYAKEPPHTVGFLVGPDGHVPPVGSGDVCPAPYVASLPKSGQTTGADQFGALLFYTFLRGWNVDHDVAFATAQTWTGDFLRVQASGDFTTTAVAWRIEFSAAPSPSIAQALMATGELTVTSGTQALQITASNSATPLVWTAAASCP